MAQVDLSIIIPIALLAALGFAGILARDVLRRDTGTERMREIAAAIQQGARAFLRRQYRTIALIAGILAVVFAGAIYAQRAATGASDAVQLGLKTAGAFALGAAFSASPAISACRLRFAPTCARQRGLSSHSTRPWSSRSAEAPSRALQSSGCP